MPAAISGATVPKKFIFAEQNGLSIEFPPSFSAYPQVIHHEWWIKRLRLPAEAPKSAARLSQAVDKPGSLPKNILMNRSISACFPMKKAEQ
ncbi:MAG: hypothetical protein LLG09_04450 [Negativicutes bacterium]|nr:hypothetical protein [Negativicutes bacterium]